MVIESAGRLDPDVCFFSDLSLVLCADSKPGFLDDASLVFVR
jgi:hypothetical protein